MARTSMALKVAIGLLMVDSIIELSFVSSMVAWLHRRAGGAFEIAYQGSSYSLHGKPLHELADQGHTSNGAAGTAFVAIGMGGILALWLRSRSSGGFARFLYKFWLIMTALSALLTFAALVFTFVITHMHSGQEIDQSVASTLNNQPYPNQRAYPLESWTPENWFDAVLELDLVSSGDRSAIDLRVHIMRGWRWNLIPMFIIGLIVSVLAFWDARQQKRAARDSKMSQKGGYA